MKSRAAALTVASILGTAGLAGAVAPAAHAATTGSGLSLPSGPARGLTKLNAALRLSPSEKQHVSFLQVGTNQGLGAVTFVDNDVTDTDTINVAVSQAGTAVGSINMVPGYTAPQLLPGGTYDVTLTDTVTGNQVPATLSVPDGGSGSFVFTSQGRAFGGGEQVDGYTDNVPSVPSGMSIVSLRNNDLPNFDVYLNGALVGTNLADGTQADVTEAPGTYNWVVTPAGTGIGDVVASGTVSVGPDVYEPLYFSPNSVLVTPFLQGYQFTAGDGGLFDYGAYPFLGSTGSLTLDKPVVGGAEDPAGDGYWLVASDGGIFSFGGAPFLGSLGGNQMIAPIVGMAATTNPQTGATGYVLVDKNGHVYTYGGATYYGGGGDPSGGGSPAVGIAADPSGEGYLIAYADGDWTQFGYGLAAPNSGGFGALTHPVVGVTSTPDGGGFWLVASDGGVFNLGDAGFYGSTGAIALNQPIVGIESTWDGLGYSLIAADGGVFGFGDAQFYGSTGNIRLNRPVVGAVANT